MHVYDPEQVNNCLLFDEEYGWDWEGNFPYTHYLRPLPEGTRVLKPGEVAVSEKELKHLRECKNKLSELEIEYDRLHEEAMIWKYESGNT